MEDAEIANTLPAGSVAASSIQGISPDPQRTQTLVDHLSVNSERLGNMLKGAWVCLGQESENPDVHSQVASSMWELMEKAQKDLTALPMQLNSGELVGQVRTLSASWKTAAIPVGDSSWDGLYTDEQKSVLMEINSTLEDFDSKYPPNSERRSAIIQALSGSSTGIPGNIMIERDEAWKRLFEYFAAIRHHNRTTTTEEITANMVELEQLLLDMQGVEIIQVLDDLDADIEDLENSL